MSTIKANTITAADLNTDLTLTGNGTGKVLIGDGGLILPDADGSAGQFLKTDGSGNLSFETPEGGKVKQVVRVYDTTSGTITITSSTYSTALTHSITPTSSSNYIVYLANCWMYTDNNGQSSTAFNSGGVEITRTVSATPTTLLNDNGHNINTMSNTAHYGSLGLSTTMVVDAPATTSQVDYAYRVRKGFAAGTNVRVYATSTRPFCLMLMEVAP